jgi:hypothetical protein
LSADVEETIIHVIKEDNPETVQQLITLLKDRLQLTESEITERVAQLQLSGRIELKTHDLSSIGPQSLQVYLRTKAASWYFIMIVLTLASAIAIFGIQDKMPESIIRYALGFVYVLGLPGYSLVRALFPGGSSSQETVRIDGIMRFSLSVVFSIAIVSMVGLALDYTWAVTLSSLVLSLSSLTILLATVAIVRENRKFNDMVRALRNGR